ncbi:MAG: hypothetical protein WAV30_00955 [Microgenomates group bacterium]
MKSLKLYSIIGALGFLFAVLYFFPIIFSKGGFGIQDWDQNFAWNEFTRVSIMEYGQFPQWNPYRCGGLPHFGNPEIGVISLQTLLVLLLGTVSGIKASIILYVGIGFFGFYIYAKQRLGTMASILAALLYAFSGITSSFLSTGMVVFIVFAFVPYVILFYEKGMTSWKSLFLSALLFALSYYNGYHISLLLGIYIACYSLIMAFASKSFQPIIRLVLFGIVSTLFILPRLILAVELIQANSTKPIDHSGYSVFQLVNSLINPFQDLYRDRGVPRYSWMADESSFYIGILAFALFIFSLFRKKWEKKARITLASLLFLLLFAFGYRSVIPLYPLMRELPVLDSFRVAQRFRFVLIIPLSLMIGYGFQQALEKTPLKIRNMIAVCAIVIIGVDLLYFAHSNYFTKTLIYDVTVPPPQKEFSQVRVAHYKSTLAAGSIPQEYAEKHAFSMWSFEYPTQLENKGVINCSDTLMSVRRAAGKDKEGYIGEWHLQNRGGELKVVRWTPQEIELEVRLTKVLSDIVVVNQNYYPGWYAYIDNGKAEVPHKWNDLLSIPIKEHTRKIVFKYEPYKDIAQRVLKIITSKTK